jgi:hypothetical protein
MIKRLTPVLIVDRIEPVLPFWKAVGFTVTAEVPHGEALGFVILARDSVEIMYQTVESVRGDEAQALAGPRPLGATGVFIEVDDLEAVNGQLPAGTEVLAKNRKTFYGSTETITREAAGNVITFAQFER